MLTLTPALDVKRSAATGTSPVWVLKIKFVGTGDVYIGDRDYTITAWAGGDRTVRGWAQDWGPIHEQGANLLEDTPVVVSDLTLPIIVPGGRTAPDTLFSRIINPLNVAKQTIVELYAWDKDLNASTDPPLKIWEGVISNWPWVDEDSLDLVLVDPHARLDRQAGTEITTSLFATADERALGQIVPIPFGMVRNAPGLPTNAGAHNGTALDAAISATTLFCSNVNEQPAFPASGTLIIAGISVPYSAKGTAVVGGITYRSFTVTALATAVSRGELVLESKAQYDYVIAPFDVKQVDNFYADRVRIAGALAASGGYNFLRFTTHPLYLMIAAQQASGASGINDTIAVNDTIGVSDTIAVGGGGDKVSVSQFPSVLVIGPTFRVFPATAVLASFPAAGGLIAQDMHFGFSTFTVSFTVATTVVISVGAFQATIFNSNINNVTPATTVFSIPGTGDNASFSLTGNSNSSYNIGFSLVPGNPRPQAQRSYFTTGVAFKSGTASKTGAATKTGTVTLTGGTVILVGTRIAESDLLGLEITWDGGGAKDDGSGTFTGTPSALIERGRDVIRWWEFTFESLPVASYAITPGLDARHGDIILLAGVVMEKEPARRVGCRMAFQIGCRLQFLADKATLWDFRRTFAPSRIIRSTEIQFLSSGRVSVLAQEVPDDWILNKMTVLYDPDPMIVAEDKRWRKTVAESDAASQATNGVRERTQLMRFSYVRDATTAAAVAKTMRQVFGHLREFHTFQQFQDGLGLQAGDAVLVADRMSGYAPGLLLSAEHFPGNGLLDRPPTFDFLLLMIREGTLVFTTEAHTVSDTLTSPADEPVIHTNLGAAAIVTLTLPPAEVGMVFCGAVVAAFALRFDPSGTEVFTTSYNDASATSPVGSVAHGDLGAGKYVGSSTVGSFIKCQCNIAGKWMVIEKIGPWAVEP